MSRSGVFAFRAVLGFAVLAVSAHAPAEATTAEEFASSVVIHRDEWGVPHVTGPTDASVAFGFAYAQAEDYFWQIEETYLQCLGRFSEIAGNGGVNSDLLNRRSSRRLDLLREPGTPGRSHDRADPRG